MSEMQRPTDEQVMKAAIAGMMTMAVVHKSKNATAQDRFMAAVGAIATTLVSFRRDDVGGKGEIFGAMAAVILETAETAGYYDVQRYGELTEWALAGCPPRTNDALRKEILDQIQEEELRAGIEGDPALLRPQAS